MKNNAAFKVHEVNFTRILLKFNSRAFQSNSRISLIKAHFKIF